MVATIDEMALTGLAEGFVGELLREGDDGYEETRRIHNGLVDKRPALIARCGGVADIVDAVNFARDEGLEISIRGGGHNVSGLAVTEGGVMIDLAALKGIHVDPAARTVRAQAGINWNEFNRETQLHGLAVTGGMISTTGIAGLTLGGGLGWLMGSQGMAVDNLISAQIVTADGRVLTASEDENSDLFWGIRGGGGNFGVAVSFEYQLHEVGPLIYGGLVAHPIDKGGDVIRLFRDFTAADVPDELTVIIVLGHAPDGSGIKLAVLAFCHTGPHDQAEKDVAPLVEFGEPALAEVGPLPYSTMNSLFDAGFPKGALNYWKSTFLRELSDDVADTMLTEFMKCPSIMGSIGIEHFHGEVTRVPVTTTAFPIRNTSYDLLVSGVWMDPADTDKNIAWAREAYSALEAFGSGERYVNYYDADEAGDPARDAYGPVYDRLVEVKNKYDPENLFHMNQNIKPTV